MILKASIDISGKNSGIPALGLEADIKDFIENGIRKGIKQVDLMKKHGVSRNTLKSYIKGIIS